MATRRKKETLYLQVPTPEGSVEFHDVTAHVGRPSPLRKPKMVCGMTVTGRAVSFSLLQLTKKSATTYTSRRLEHPRKATFRLDRMATENDDLPVGHIRIISDVGTQDCRILDEGGIIELDPLADDISFDLPKGAMRTTILMRVAALDRIVSIGFVGYPGKPGTPSNLRRNAAMALYTLTLLAPFRMLTGIETVTIPAPPRMAVSTVRKDLEARIVLPVWLFNDTPGGAPEPAGNGSIDVSVDLDHANPTTGRPVLHLQPSEEIAGNFDAYRQIAGDTIHAHLKEEIGEVDLKELTLAVVLGDLGEGHVGMLNEALAKLESGLDLTPTMYQKHS